MFFLVKYFMVTFSPIQLRSGKRLMIIELLFSLSVLTRKLYGIMAIGVITNAKGELYIWRTTVKLTIAKIVKQKMSRNFNHAGTGRY